VKIVHLFYFGEVAKLVDVNQDVRCKIPR